ncbi:ABC transporter ATP-binding protein [Ammoniphilus sp. YIM 78166]|uniref:ABC transporter ATP-binding protein n=1 Tax=Ammoniphilus sp. YIM 78166 TaxID=1644106 RepID=UPI00106F1309|nr:ABC transporter ATP-binding protein [Ammoniphilus sp. YIM 78166]
MGSRSLFAEYVRLHKGKYLFGAALLSISCLLQLVIPRLLEKFTNGVQSLTITFFDTFQLALWITAIGFGVAFFRSTSRIYIFRLSRQLERNIRDRLFQQWEKMPPEYYKRQRIGDLMSHAINDVNVTRDVAMQGVFMTVEAVILITVTVIAMSTTIHASLTLLVMLPLPALSYMAYKFRFQIQERSLRVQEAIGLLASRVQEFCAGIRVVKAYVQEQDQMKKFMEDNQNNVMANRNLIRSNSLFTSISQGIVGLSYLISVLFGGILTMRGTITLGEFVAFNTYLSFLVSPVENLGKVINTLQRGRAADLRLREILALKPAVQDDVEVLPITSLNGSIQVSHLSFTYPGDHSPTLRDINLSIPQGSSIAIVGKVGSGKTTLVNLLMRMYNPPKGTIFIDGLEISQIPLRVLRESIGFVPQENFLFSTTIAENIAFDPKSYQQSHIEEAAKLAQVYENIVHFPKKFDTPLGERGTSLSGGQRQRVSIARAVIKDPPILIFDDSLSAVDAQTEEQILEGLRKVKQGRTTIMVSHRISTIMDCNQIIVMDNGRIIEQGNHYSLLQQEGIYAQMYKIQQAGFDLEHEGRWSEGGHSL